MDFNQERIDAKKAMDRAQVRLDKAQAEYDEAEEAFTEDWKAKNPNGSKAEMLDYFETKLQRYSATVESCKAIYMKLVEIHQRMIDKKESPSSDQLLADRVEKVSDRIISAIRQYRLSQFPLRASSESDSESDGF